MTIEQAANIKSGMEVSRLDWKLLSSSTWLISVSTGPTEVIGERKLLDTHNTTKILIKNKTLDELRASSRSIFLYCKMGAKVSFVSGLG